MVNVIGLIGVLVLTALIGYQSGRIRERYSVMPPVALSLVPDTRPLEPTVILSGVVNGQLEGRVHGNPRLFVGDHMVLVQSGAFSLPVGNFFVNQISVHVPDGMEYVASKKGKNFYSVRSPSGEKIVPDNRVYFATAKEALAAGYAQAQ